jgi:hypothetical protein
MTKLPVRVVICALLVMLAACGGGGKSDSAATTTSAADAVTTTKATAELPDFANDFDRVCTTQVGFPGATSYEPVPGTHPMLFFEEYDGKSWVNSSRTFPQGWAIKEDTNFKDNSDLKPVQLIACADRVKETPTGKQCEFDDKGTKTKLELVNSTYQLTVYTATTGKSVKTETLETKTTECPYFATFKKGDTTWVDTPSDDQYIAALKSVVAA